MKRTENNKFVLNNCSELFLPEKDNAFSFDSLVDVKEDKTIILPFALIYGNKPL